MLDLIPFWAWSFILAAFGLAGIWLAGSGKRVGWALGIFTQVLWLAYALATDQLGFCLTAVAYALVYARNWRKWRCEEHRRAETARLPQLEARRIPYSPTMELLKGRTAA